MNEDPIVIVEDNMEDCRFLTEALGIVGVKNPLKCFDNGASALKYLQETTEKTGMIISDIKMPIMNGLELRREILNDKRIVKKNIPFVFLTTRPPSYFENEVKTMSVQGHFKKPGNIEDMIHITRSIIDGWNQEKEIA